MDFKLELIVVPVSDLDRAKAFYLEQAGFDLVVPRSRMAREGAALVERLSAAD